MGWLSYTYLHSTATASVSVSVRNVYPRFSRTSLISLSGSRGRGERQRACPSSSSTFADNSQLVMIPSARTPTACQQPHIARPPARRLDPLCTKLNSFLASLVCGWQLRGDGVPCVAHRVCAIEVCVMNVLFMSILVEGAAAGRWAAGNDTLSAASPARHAPLQPPHSLPLLGSIMALPTTVPGSGSVALLAMSWRRPATLPTCLKRMSGSDGESPSMPMPVGVGEKAGQHLVAPRGYKGPQRARTGTVVPAVLEPRETIAEHLAHVLAVLLREERAVGKDSWWGPSGNARGSHRGVRWRMRARGDGGGGGRGKKGAGKAAQ